MLTHSGLAALHRILANKRVLSVYVDGSATDPAIQRSWRVQLDNSLADLRRWLKDSPREEREEFERCVLRLDSAIAPFTGSVGAPGWAAFITADQVNVAEQLPAPAPTLAVWSNGPCIAPYVRALKESRPAIIARADARRVSIFRYRLGAVDRLETVRAHQLIDHPEHMGTPAQAGFHTGTRGTAGHDAVQRTLLRGRDRMISDAVERIHALAGDDGWILVGGINRVAARLATPLEVLAPDRVARIGKLDVHSSESDIARAARAEVSALRNAVDDRQLAEIVEQAGAHGLGAVGPDDARQALEQSSVRALYVTQRYVEQHAADAEWAIREALDQDAAIEEVSGAAAERLDQHGGIAAGLRFRPSAVALAGTGA